MHRIIAGGTGFIGRYLVKEWLSKKYTVTVIGRSHTTIRQLFGNTVQSVIWNELDEKGIELFHSASLVVNFAGANIGEGRWTPQRKKTIVNSRLEATDCVSKICASLADRSPILLNASAVGVYGLQNPQVMNEDTDIDFYTYPDFVSEVARQWESATDMAKAHGVHVLNLRLGIVLGSQGGALTKLALPFKLGIGGVIGQGKQTISWIHIADVAAIIEFLVAHTNIYGPINCVAPQRITQAEFAHILAKTLHRPCWLPMPSKLLQGLYGQMADELLLSGQNVHPKKLLEHHYSFLFPDLASALNNIYQ